MEKTNYYCDLCGKKCTRFNKLQLTRFLFFDIEVVAIGNMDLCKDCENRIVKTLRECRKKVTLE